MFFSTSPIKLLKKIRAVTLTLSVLGIVLSGYSIYVHQRKDANKDYKAFCDISEDVSCSKVFTSKWGKGFGILGSVFGEDSPLVLPNGFYGIAFYLLVIALGELQSVTAANIQKYAVLLTNLLSVYLGYILLFVLKDKCVVCFSIYIINFITAVMCFLRAHYITALKSKKKGNKGQASNQNVKNAGKKNQQNQNVNKNNQNTNNKSNQTANKTEQVPKKKKEKVQKQNAEQPVVNHQNAVNTKKNEQHKNAQNNVKNRQNQNQSKKNTQQNAVQQNQPNKQQVKSNANQSKHSKKKNN